MRIKLILTLSILFSTVNVFAQCSGITNLNPSTLPQGLDYYYVLNSKGIFVTEDSLTNNTGTSFDAFKATILPNIKTAALQFFANNWGVVFTGGNTVSDSGEWNLQSKVMPLEYDQKIVFSGGETVPASGWKVYQAEWQAAANTDYAQITTGPWADEKLAFHGLASGTYPIPVMFGTSLAYGVYRISCTDGSTTTEFDIHYVSIRPLFPDIMSSSISTKYISSRAPNIYYLSLDNGSTWTGQGRGRFELENRGADYRAVSSLVMKFYTP